MISSCDCQVPLKDHINIASPIRLSYAIEGEAIQFLKRYISKESNLKHMIAVGAIMKEIASKISQDEAEWELIGLLHDIDFEVCGHPSNHTLKARELLREIVSESITEVIMAHNYEHTKVPVDTIEKKH